MEKQKLNQLSQKLTADRNNYMKSFRHNLDLYIAEKDITIREISELSDVPYSTMHTLLYGDAADAKLSTVVKLSIVLGISMDELVGAETIEPLSRESLSICRNLPEHFVYLIRSYIRHVWKMYTKVDSTDYHIPIMLPECHDGHLHTTNVTELSNIQHLPESIRFRISHGLKIPCEHYEPYYMPGDILLLAVDRDGLNNEICVISKGGNFYIARKKSYISNGEKRWKYVSLFNEKEFLKEEIDDKLGYVAGFLNPDGSWGVR